MLFHLGININYTLGQQSQRKPLLELYEDNDMLLFLKDGTDKYYTNGTKIAYHYFRKRNKFKFFDRALIGFKTDTNKRYSWGLIQIMLTPENISKEQLEKDDWPYAGALFLSHTLYSVNKNKNLGIRSECLLGILGSWSFASETQIFVHKLINSTPPKGWNWQINNYPIINYNLLLEPKIYTSKYFDAIGSVESNLGTLMNQFRTGLKFKLGFKNNYYVRESQRFQCYLTYLVNGGFVLYSAYLEGGFFDKRKYEQGISKGYRLAASEIEKIYLENQIGLNFRYKDFGVSYIMKYRTRQTTKTTSHLVGNISMYIPLYINKNKNYGE